MGTVQLMFVFLSFVLFSYFVLISNQHTEMMLRESAKQEMFDDMITIGDLANEYYLSNTTTALGSDLLQSMVFGWSSSITYSTMVLQSGTTYTVVITGIVGFPSGTADPAYWTSNNWATQSPDICCNYNTVIGRPDNDIYSSSHSYTWTIAGQALPLLFQTNGCLTSATFIVDIYNKGGTVQQDTVNSYSGFTPPAYLTNRPYSNLTIEIVSDSVIHFIGSTSFEDSVTYIRQCTPSNSMALIP
jgi:hypothetical protein